jgi:leader peptidase (prepilin peptidase)/N-methyltransferase
MIAVVAFAFLLGLAVGSFATAVAHRTPRGISIAWARSECPACRARIIAYDNAPVVSWVVLRGRARCCGARISPRYPVTELAVGALFAVTVLVYRNDAAEAAIGLVFVAMLAIVTLTDLERRTIPNKVLLAAAVLCIAIAIPTLAACPSVPSRPAALGPSSFWSPSPTRKAWGSATSSWPRPWAYSSAALWHRRSSRRC